MPVDHKAYEALGAKEQPYRKRRKGIGIRDAIKRKTNVTTESDAFGRAFFRMIIAAAPLTKCAPTNWAIRKVAMLGGEHNTRGHSIPVHLDSKAKIPAKATLASLDAALDHGACDEGRSTSGKIIDMHKMVARDVEHIHPPIEMVIDAIKRSSFRAGLSSCLCREIQGCKDYPRDIGCLFLGPAARDCVARGVARELTEEDAIRHVKRAVEAGLSPAAYFVEIEEYVWGWPDEDLPNVLEICFCCPCCCSAVRFEKRAGGELERILHQGVGWSCVVDTTACIGCGACEMACPHDCVHVEDGTARIHRSCAGCGQCVRVCEHGALRVVQTGDTKERIDDYFEKLGWTL